MDHLLLSIAVFLSVIGTFWFVCTPLLSAFSKYRKLSESVRLECNARFVSTIHAAWVTYIALYVVIMEDPDDLVWFAPTYAKRNIAVCMGFLTADTFLMLLYWKDIGGTKGHVVHHSVAVTAYVLCLSNGYLTYFANFRLIAELSTSFLNIRWVLSAMDEKGGKVYYYNGLVLTATFFISRVAVIPYFYYLVYNLVQTDVYKSGVGQTVHIVWISVCLILDYLNIIWFHKMVRGIRQYLHSDTKKDNKSL